MRRDGAGDADRAVVVGQSIIYLISAVLEPPADLIETAMSNLALSTFVATIYAAHVEWQVRAEQAVSWFVPTNDAFAALGLTVRARLTRPR